jgi:hypothetical protein
MLRPLIIALALLATPAFAAVDRVTAVSTLAGLYNSADVCNLPISRAKVDDYRDANAPSGDSLFNFVVFQATHALYDQQKSWTKEQTADYCKKAIATAKDLDMGLAK